MSFTIKLLFLLLMSFISVALSGCASPALKESMVVNSISGVKKYNKTVSVKSEGGSEIDDLGRSDISNADFTKAIEESIMANELFAKVIHGAGSDYILTVFIVSTNKPIFGGDFTVDMECAWTLSDSASKNDLMRKSIKSSYTVTTKETLMGAKRLRLALEGAARKNIEQGLLAISQMQLGE